MKVEYNKIVRDKIPKIIEEIINNCATSAKAYVVDEFGERKEDSKLIDRNSILKLKEKYLKSWINLKKNYHSK